MLSARTSELVTAVAGVLKKEPCRACFRDELTSKLPELLQSFHIQVKGIRNDFKVITQLVSRVHLSKISIF